MIFQQPLVNEIQVTNNVLSTYSTWKKNIKAKVCGARRPTRIEYFCWGLDMLGLGL